MATRKYLFTPFVCLFLFTQASCSMFGLFSDSSDSPSKNEKEIKLGGDEVNDGDSKLSTEKFSNGNLNTENPGNNEKKDNLKVTDDNFAEQKKVGKDKSSTEVEVIWKIPKTPVKEYLIKYGFSKSEINKEKRVSLEDLGKYDDPTNGFVYKYTLQGVPPNKTVYLSVTSVAPDGTKLESPVWELGK